MSLWPEIEKILPAVERPSRYIDGEWGAVHKPFEGAKVRMALAYPDLYEVGMSHIGLQILYDILNKQEDVLAERVYAPWLDLEKFLRQRKIPLFTLESHLPVSRFDIFGFSLQTEMTYANILNMLDLAGIPLYASERGDSSPLIVGGGPCVFNPEPLAPFFDLFVIGEGEEIILEIVEEYKKFAVHSSQLKVKDKKRELLKNLVRIPGVYVPSFYDVHYDKEGKVRKVEPLIAEAPPVVLKRVIQDLDAAPFSTSPIVPFMDIIHQRASLEVMRGCTRGCRFCQAGIIYRPSRERSVEHLLHQTDSLLRRTGYPEISLVSLSTSDYSFISPLLQRLAETLSQNGVSISLPSLRMDTFSVDLANRVGKVKKTGLTFAPEAGTPRLRKVINKEISEEVLLKTAKSAFEAGWEKLKLYFMFGLPSERAKDLEGIVILAQKIVRECLAAVPPRRRGRARITFNVSPFVPKAHTPFQWVAQNSLSKLREKQRFLKRNLRGRSLVFKTHDAQQSIVEGALARGDRRSAKALRRAWERGARFDAWKENFDFDLWSQAFEETGLSLDFYTNRERLYDETFPWDHISSGVSKEFLWGEYERAKKGEVTPDCKGGLCTDCQACLELGIPISSRP